MIRCKILLDFRNIGSAPHWSGHTTPSPGTITTSTTAFTFQGIFTKTFQIRPVLKENKIEINSRYGDTKLSISQSKHGKMHIYIIPCNLGYQKLEKLFGKK
jgi:hypothetical protein